MNECASCSKPITGQYFRKGSTMVCPECVAKEREDIRVNRQKDLWMGLLYGSGAALLGSLAEWWAAQALMPHSFDMMGWYWFVIIGISVSAGVATHINIWARKGSRDHGSVWLQLGVCLLLYWSVSLGVVWMILTHLPASARTPQHILTMIAVAPVYPVLAVTKNSGVAVFFVMMAIAINRTWGMNGPPSAIEGPFDIATTGGKPEPNGPMFETLAL